MIIILVIVLFTIPVVQASGSDNWAPVGSESFTPSTAEYTSLVMDSNDIPYVAYRDYANDYKASVMKFNGTSWVNVGSAGFSAGEVKYVSLAIDSSDTLYVSFQDYGNGEKITVKKFDGTDWVDVGSAGISAGTADQTSLAIDSSDTPYVAYKDDGNAGKATVMKYTGAGSTGWEEVGTAGFTADGAYYISLIFDSNDTPYIAFMDMGNYLRATVMKYNGSSWELVGSAGFSNGSATYTSLAFDRSDKPYVTYREGDSSKATVMNYTGAGPSGWERVGNAGFSVGMGHYTSLAIDSNDTPYVAFRDDGFSGKATVKRFNGASWEVVGTIGFSTGGTKYTSLALDSNDTPYVAYMDMIGVGFKATVMRLNTAPTSTSLDNNSILENESVGAIVGLLSTDDTDDYDSHTYRLVSGIGADDNGSFSIDGNTLKTAESFDFETKSTYTIRVKATDSGGLGAEQQFTINVLDVDDNYTVSVTAGSNGSVSPSGNQTISHGNDLVITPSPAVGYEVDSITSSASHTITNNGNGTYTIENITQDDTLQITFKQTHYTISYDNNGGSGSITNDSGIYNNIITLSNGSGFSKPNAVLESWDIGSLGGLYTITGNVTANAVWVDDTDGDGVSDSDEIAAGTDKDDPNNKPQEETLQVTVLNNDNTSGSGYTLILNSTPIVKTTDSDGDAVFTGVSLSSHTLSLRSGNTEIANFMLDFTKGSSNSSTITGGGTGVSATAATNFKSLNITIKLNGEKTGGQIESANISERSNQVPNPNTGNHRANNLWWFVLILPLCLVGIYVKKKGQTE